MGWATSLAEVGHREPAAGRNREHLEISNLLLYSLYLASAEVLAQAGKRL